jgi:branched-chain amino acid transport system substrate-binding protein
LKQHNMELAESVPVAITDTDMRPHAMRLRRSNADAVLLFMTPGGAARLIGTGKSVNYEPLWMSTTTCGDCPMMIDITQGLYNGVITPSFGVIEPTGNVGNAQHINTPEHPLMVKYKTEVFDRYAASDERWGYTFTVGIGLAEPLVEAIKRAGRDLTREKLVEELENMQDFKGMMGKVSYMPFDPDNPLTRIGQQEIYLQQCQADGSALVLTDWIETYYIPVGH